MFNSSFTSMSVFHQFGVQSRYSKEDSLLCRRILSRSEFLYRNMRHSSAVLARADSKLRSLSPYIFTVSSSSLMYSMRRSRNAACASRFLCLLASAVNVCRDCQRVPFQINGIYILASAHLYASEETEYRYGAIRLRIRSWLACSKPLQVDSSF